MAKPDNPHAFPTFVAERVYRDNADRVGHIEQIPTGGMSLRDAFAMSAASGKADWQGISPRGAQEVARSAYAIADAMLKQREEE